jgi:two-component system chemotaxis sensor kinase CheA
MNEFLEQFVIEARELVSQGNDDLLALEESPADRERLDGAFRAFHTLKGAAGIVDFPAMAKALHAAEDGLSAVRSGSAAVTPPLIDLCLACLDQVAAWIDQTQARGDVPDDADALADALAGRFATMASAAAGPADGEQPAQVGAPSPIASQILEAQKLLVLEHPSGSAQLASAATVAVNLMRAHRLDRQELARSLRAHADAGDADALAHAIDQLSAEFAGQSSGQAGAMPAQPSDSTVRIDVARVDALVRLTGELTVAKNAVGHTASQVSAAADVARLAAALRDQHLQLERLVAELQQTVFGLRILPLSHAFQRFPRHVRELAATLGKPARLIVEGGATEADKTIVEAIAEPLLHLVRNALDHGVEDPARRSARAKPAIATLHLRANRTGDRVVIELEDDGGGLDIARIRDAAQRKGVVTAAALASLSDEEVQDLIFAPGFSTAADVTDLSGRGVGLDVVRSTVERLGGRVSVASRPGQGTRVSLALPFTVMMTRVLTVEAGGQAFGVPLDFVVETARVPRAKVSPIGAARAFAFRDRTVPVIHLGEALGNAATSEATGDATILVVSVGGELGGLEVDRLGDRLDVMLKPPEGLLVGIPGIDGTTLLGDGRVLIVLDLQEIFGNDRAPPERSGVDGSSNGS